MLGSDLLWSSCRSVWLVVACSWPYSKNSTVRAATQVVVLLWLVGSGQPRATVQRPCNATQLRVVATLQESEAPDRERYRCTTLRGCCGCGYRQPYATM